MMRKPVLLLTILSSGLLGLCLFLFYAIVDRSVSLDHLRSGERERAKERAVLRSLTLDLTRSITKAEVKALLTRKYAQTNIVKDEDENTIFVDGVGLRFRGEQLEEVVFMSDEGTKSGSLTK